MTTANKTANLRIQENVFFLEGVLDFDTVLNLLPAVKKAIKSVNALEIDLSAVTYTNSAGVALLLDILRKAQKHQALVTFRNIPKDMLEIIHISGLQDVLVNPVSA